jgi:1-acyl-sn-glycerol-3-phosphate acyltransferase
MRSRLMAWFSKNVIGIVAVSRTGHAKDQDPLVECHAALDRGEILIVFPEGTRGEPEHMTKLHCGIAYLAERHADVPVVTVFMHGLGKSMPGALVPVPGVADIVLGEPFVWPGNRESYMGKLHTMFGHLRDELDAPDYL